VKKREYAVTFVEYTTVVVAVAPGEDVEDAAIMAREAAPERVIIRKRFQRWVNDDSPDERGE
jgi:hypothetical protein